MIRLVVAVIIGSLLNISVLFAQNREYDLLIHSRSRSGVFVNNIRVNCRILSNTTDDPYATYWLNETTVVNGVQWNGEFDATGIEFTLTRETEGNYTCGRTTGTRSEPKTLVVLPTTEEINSDTIFYTSFGSAATLTCPITPGRLREHYSCEWKKNNSIIAQYQPEFPTSSSTPPKKYSIDPETFSLTIFNVVGEDNSSLYTCEVKVTVDDIMHTYDQTLHLYLTLKVNALAVIESGPTPQTVSTSAQEAAMFTCVAIGLPAPTITWTDNGGNVVKNNSQYGIYTQTSRIPRPNDGRIEVTSTLTIDTFDHTDNGDVTCIAETPSSGTPVEESTTLAVLSTPTEEDVQITGREDVVFILRFANVIRHAVMQLNVTYTDLDTETTLPYTIREEEYMNTDRIYHIDDRSIIPTNFRVMVNVVANLSNAPVSGPTIDFNGKKYSRDQPTGCDIEDIAKIAGLSAGLGLPLLITALTIIGFIVYVAIKLKENAKKKRQMEQLRADKDREMEQLRHNSEEEQRRRDAAAEQEREKFARNTALRLCKRFENNPNKFIQKFKEYRAELLRTGDHIPEHDGDGSEQEGVIEDQDEGFEEMLSSCISTESENWRTREREQPNIETRL